MSSPSTPNLVDEKHDASFPNDIEVAPLPAGEGEVEVLHVQRRKGLAGLYDSSMTQVCILGMVCFLGPGMFNALGGMGGGGLADPSAAVKANIALYSVFAGLSFVSGSVHNLIGSKLIVLIGA